MKLSDIAPQHAGMPDDDAPEACLHVFPTISDAADCARAMSATIAIPPALEHLQGWLYASSGGVLMIAIAKDKSIENQHDLLGEHWRLRAGFYRKCLNVPTDDSPESDKLSEVDSLVRFIQARDNTTYYVIASADGDWMRTFTDNAKTRLRGTFRDKLLEYRLNRALAFPWTEVTIPFQPEWLPDARQYNPRAPQLKFAPAPGPHPTWDSILDHFFHELDEVLANPKDEDAKWCVKNDITTGRDYGIAWIAALIADPFQPLPFLFGWNEEQNIGKSSLHESIGDILTAGVAQADRALRSEFNGEIRAAILATIEETDLNKPGVGERIKKLVTSPTIQVRRMRTDAYEQPNTLHFIQTANDINYCPVFPGDQRVVVLHYMRPETIISRSELRRLVTEVEGAAFTHTLIERGKNLPSQYGRLFLPVLETASKRQLMDSNVSDIGFAIVEMMREHQTWTGNTAALRVALDDDTLPSDPRVIRRDIETAKVYLSDHKITADLGQRKGRNGKIITLTRGKA